MHQPKIEPTPPPFAGTPPPGSSPMVDPDACRAFVAAATTDLANGARMRGFPPPPVVLGVVDALAGMVCVFWERDAQDGAVDWIAELVRQQIRDRHGRAN